MGELAWVLPIGVALLGLLVGSFLNVVIARVPEGRSIVRPRSACPTCGTAIAARDNIPVVSWLLLHGRCRTCGAAIAWRYPLVELGTVGLWLGVWWWGLGAGLAFVPLGLVLVSVLFALAVIDLDCQRLPRALVWPLYPITAVGLGLAAVLGAEVSWVGVAVGASAWLVVVGGLWLVTRGRGMGFGDVTLAPVLGATLGALGVGTSIVGLFLAFILGAMVGVVLLMRKRAQRGSQLAFGPFLIGGWALAAVVGPAVWSWYAAGMGL